MTEKHDPYSSPPPCELPISKVNFYPGSPTESQYTEFKADPALTAQGWERRYTADPIRVDEAVQLYSELGYEVHIEAVKPSEFTDACQACGLSVCHTYGTIYTRKK